MQRGTITHSQKGKKKQEHTESRLAQATLGESLKKKRRSQQHREVRLRTLVENASTAGRFDLE